MYNDELPHEIILAIQRVLELKSSEDASSLDALSVNFNPADVLNDLFPDGMLLSPLIWVESALVLTFKLRAEASLAHIDAVQSRLVESQLELQREIDIMRSELAKNQDPERMQLIQEMISVCPGVLACSR